MQFRGQLPVLQGREEDQLRPKTRQQLQIFRVVEAKGPVPGHPQAHCGGHGRPGGFLRQRQARQRLKQTVQVQVGLQPVRQVSQI